MKEEFNRIEKIREYLKEKWYRFQCYRKMEIFGLEYGYIPRGEELRNYLKYSIEEMDRNREEANERAKQEVLDLIEHWDEKSS